MLREFANPGPSGAFPVCHSHLPFPDPFAIVVCHSRTHSAPVPLHLPFQFAIPGPIPVWNGKWSDPRQGPGMGLERQCFENLPIRARPAPFPFAIPICHSRTRLPLSFAIPGPIPHPFHSICHSRLPFPDQFPSGMANGMTPGKGQEWVWNANASRICHSGPVRRLSRLPFPFAIPGPIPGPIPDPFHCICHSRLPFQDQFPFGMANGVSSGKAQEWVWNANASSICHSRPRPAPFPFAIPAGTPVRMTNQNGKS